jgi:hypothetical protein
LLRYRSRSNVDCIVSLSACGNNPRAVARLLHF